MSDSEQTLARIDEVLGFSDDVSIEWDHTTSGDAMRSRPLHRRLSPDIISAHIAPVNCRCSVVPVFDETTDLDAEAWRSLWAIINDRRDSSERAIRPRDRFSIQSTNAYEGEQ